MAFPVEPFGTQESCRQLSAEGQQFFNGFLKFSRQHIVGIVTKSGALKADIGRSTLHSTAPEAAKGFEPRIMNFMGLEKVMEWFPIKMGKFAGTWKTPDVGNRTNLTFFQKPQQVVKATV